MAIILEIWHWSDIVHVVWSHGRVTSDRSGFGKMKVNLNPSPGFTVKSTTLNDALYNNIPVPKGLKIFVNIAWDKNVPPPPEGSEDVIQKAMLGEDLNDLNPEGWYVPTVVSEGREDKDKGACTTVRLKGSVNPPHPSRKTLPSIRRRLQLLTQISYTQRPRIQNFPHRYVPPNLHTQPI
jgi:hypothetical protein